MKMGTAIQKAWGAKHSKRDTKSYFTQFKQKYEQGGERSRTPKRCELRAGFSQLQFLELSTIFNTSCELRAGFSQLQSGSKANGGRNSCELRAGFSQLQFLELSTIFNTSCELRAGFSQLQSGSKANGGRNSCELRAGFSQLQ